ERELDLILPGSAAGAAAGDRRPEGQADPRAAGAGPASPGFPFSLDRRPGRAAVAASRRPLARQLARHRRRAGAHRPGRVLRRPRDRPGHGGAVRRVPPVFLASLPRGVPPSAGLGGAPPAVPALLPAHPPEPFRRSLRAGGGPHPGPLRPVMHAAEAGLEGRPPRARPPLAEAIVRARIAPRRLAAGRARVVDPAQPRVGGPPVPFRAVR